MQVEGFRVTRDFEQNHWWFRSRRDLIRLQLTRAAEALGYPGKRLRLLDFGCGTGFNLPLLGEFGEASGADRLRPEYESFRINPEYPLLDVERDLPSREASFDLVTAFDVLEHIEDDVDGLQRIAKLVVPGGRMLLTVPAYQWLWSGEDEISEHKRRYTRSGLEQVCRRADLKIEYASYFNMSILPAMAASVFGRRLLRRDADQASNLDASPGWLNEALYRLTAGEAALVGGETVRMPAGASIVCRLLKDTP